MTFFGDPFWNSERPFAVPGVDRLSLGLGVALPPEDAAGGVSLLGLYSARFTYGLFALHMCFADAKV